MLTSDAERSLKQVLAYRERLANTIDAHEESHRHLSSAGGLGGSAGGYSPGSRAEPEPEELTDSLRSAEHPEARAAAASGDQQSPPPRRSRNASFFE